MTPFDLEKSFKTYLSQTRGLSSVTIKNYLSDFHHFASWLLKNQKFILPEAEKNVSQVEKLLPKIDQKVIQKYKTDLLSLKIAKSTTKRRLSTVRIFCQFCLKQGWLSQNPGRKVENPSSLTDQEKNIRDLTSKFNSWLKNQGMSENTVKNYLADIKNFLTWREA